MLERELAVRHPRRAGQKEDRYEQLLGGAAVEATEGKSPASETNEAPADPPLRSEPVDEDRLDRIEREITALRAELSSLREALGEEGTTNA